MSWHVITKVGTADNYAGDIPRAEGRIYVAIDRPGDRWSVGNDIFQITHERTGNAPAVIATDLLHLALSVYSADLQIERRFFDDRWGRDLIVHLPVSDPDRWQPLVPHINRMLAYLTGDTWQLHVRSMEPLIYPQPKRPKPPTLNRNVDRASLFSGGLDSLAGAIDLLEQGETIALTGHHGAGTTNGFQQNVLRVLKASYGDRVVDFMFFVQPPKNGREGEPSMRSRSMLFLSLGVAVASALGGGQPLVVAENGLISLNVPLTNPRMGSLSTRTTHPYFLSLFRELLDRLGITTKIETPYRFQTKGEMLVNIRNPAVLAQTARESMSCSHPEAGRYQGKSPNKHCGYCVPCIIRRSSMVAAGIPDAAYNYDVVTETIDAAREIGADLRAFHIALERFAEAKPHQALFRVLSTGPLPPEEAKQYAAVYTRGMKEVGRLLMPGRFDGTIAS